MSSFSYTAPRITSEQEAEEIAALSIEERREIQSDLYGIGGADLEQEHSADSIEAKCRKTREELENFPESEKNEYLEALEKCPDLVERESHPLRFLRAERFSPELAAKRIVAYWKMRKTVFGDVKAFCPMALLGKEGCLTDEEKSFLAEHGGISTHPLPDDAHGRAVIFMDRTRVTAANMKSIQPISLLRIYWCLTHLALAEREESLAHPPQQNHNDEDGEIASTFSLSSSTAGVADFVLLINARLATLNQFQRMYAKLQFDSFKKALPIRLCALHVVATSITCSFALPSIKFLMGPHIRLRARVHEETRFSTTTTTTTTAQSQQQPLHRSRSSDTLVEDGSFTSSGSFLRNGPKLPLPDALEEYGLERDHLPKALGGNFVFQGREWFCNQVMKAVRKQEQEREKQREERRRSARAQEEIFTQQQHYYYG